LIETRVKASEVIRTKIWELVFIKIARLSFI